LAARRETRAATERVTRIYERMAAGYDRQLDWVEGVLFRDGRALDQFAPGTLPKQVARNLGEIDAGDTQRLERIGRAARFIGPTEQRAVPGLRQPRYEKYVHPASRLGSILPFWPLSDRRSF